MLFNEETRAKCDAVMSVAAVAHDAQLVDMRDVYVKYDNREITVEDGLRPFQTPNW